MKKLFFIFLALMFVGCSSTSSNVSHVSNLQVKVARIESRMNKRDKELERLKEEVQEIAQLVEGLETYNDDINEDFESVKIDEPVMKKTVAKPKPKKASASSTKSIIRVSVDPKEIQNALAKAGYYGGSIDGKIGNRTKNAVLEFQKDHGLVVDGIIGKKTWLEMKSYLD